MRPFGFLLSLLAAGVTTFTTLAQTNSSAAGTNGAETKSMSLEDCVEIALHHNLDIEIQRYNPQINAFNLGGLYGSYEPNLYVNGEHDENQQPGGVDSQGRAIPGAEIRTDRYAGGFSGLLPWGLNYNLGINLIDQTTIRPPIPGGNFTNVVQNTFFVPSWGSNVTFLSTNTSLTGVPGITTETYSGEAGFLQLRQPLLKNFWIDNTRLQIFLDKKTLQQSELTLRGQVMTTINAVEQAYYNLIFSQENVKVQQKAVELAERQLAENKKRVEVGAMAPLDEKQAESQVASSQADLFNALGSEETQQRVLKNLLSDDYSKWATVVIQPTAKLLAVPQRFDLQDSWRKGMSMRPDLISQRVSLEKQGYIVKYNRNQLFPQLDMIGTLGYNSSSPNFNGYLDQFKNRDNLFWSAGGQMTFPLGNGTARNNLKAAKAAKDQATLGLKQLEQNVMVTIENDIATANTRFQQVTATREARVYAEAALEAEQKKLESGKSTSFVVLQLTRDLTSARSAEISALANYNISLSQLALDEGTTLERRHVTLQWK
jgi:outer membrane protein TolC